MRLVGVGRITSARPPNPLKPGRVLFFPSSSGYLGGASLDHTCKRQEGCGWRKQIVKILTAKCGAPRNDTNSLGMYMRRNFVIPRLCGSFWCCLFFLPLQEYLLPVASLQESGTTPTSCGRLKQKTQKNRGAKILILCVSPRASRRANSFDLHRA